MGMFDSFYFPRKMPDNFHQRMPVGEPASSLREIPSSALYQTKDMDSDLDIYTVDEQDRLMCYRSRTFNKSKAPSNELEFVEYTGTIDIYTDIPQKGEFGYPNKYIESLPTTTSSRWVEYVLTFEGGILKNVRSMFEDDVE